MDELRVGILGAGRSRAGLGPYFARWFESSRVGARVVAVAGRNAARTEAVAADLAGALGHAVEARDGGATGLLAPGDLDALVVAAPPEAHLAALEAAADAGVPTLCEKPLVPVAETDRALAVVDRFAAAGVLLVENCQWPETLGAFLELHPEASIAPQEGVKVLEMRLSPSQRGRAMLVDSLSHFLSLLQELAAGAPLEIVDVSFSGPPAPDLVRLTVDLRVRLGAGGEHGATLRLEHCAEQPRPAFYEVSGLRLDREVELPSYRMFARSGDRRVPMDDPLGALVYRFALAVRESDHERIERHAERIRGRARLFFDLVTAWDRSDDRSAS